MTETYVLRWTRILRRADRERVARRKPARGQGRVVASAREQFKDVVGFLYSLGAVLLAVELQPTHVATQDALPPLPQMLGRGSALLGSFGAFLVFRCAF